MYTETCCIFIVSQIPLTNPNRSTLYLEIFQTLWFSLLVLLSSDPVSYYIKHLRTLNKYCSSISTLDCTLCSGVLRWWCQGRGEGWPGGGGPSGGQTHLCHHNDDPNYPGAGADLTRPSSSSHVSSSLLHSFLLMSSQHFPVHFTTMTPLSFPYTPLDLPALPLRLTTSPVSHLPSVSTISTTLPSNQPPSTTYSRQQPIWSSFLDVPALEGRPRRHTPSLQPSQLPPLAAASHWLPTALNHNWQYLLHYHLVL